MAHPTVGGAAERTATAIRYVREQQLAEQQKGMDVDGIVRCGFCSWTYAGLFSTGRKLNFEHRREAHPETILAQEARETKKHYPHSTPATDALRVTLDDERLRQIEAAIRVRPMTTHEIGELIGENPTRTAVSLSAASRRGDSVVKHEAKRNGSLWYIGEPPITAAIQEVVNALRDGPLSNSGIAKRLGCHPNGIYNKCKAAVTDGRVEQRPDKMWQLTPPG